MARVEMHCIAAAFDRGEIPGFPVLCVTIGGGGVEAGGGGCVVGLGESASSSFGLILGDSISHSLRNSTSPVHAVAFTYVACCRSTSTSLLCPFASWDLGPVCLRGQSNTGCLLLLPQKTEKRSKCHVSLSICRSKVLLICQVRARKCLAGNSFNQTEKL